MRDFSKYPIRTCRSKNGLDIGCEICGYPILKGNKYHDGGFANRAHVSCVTENKLKLRRDRVVQISEIRGRLSNAFKTGMVNIDVNGEGIPKDTWNRLCVQLAETKAAMNQFFEAHKDDGTFI